ncbi:DUF983 domain-containing protein [Flavobacterium psychrophilum]|uniref:DUF983 domain-containing protein n=1 Tax=Flavobacterium psychrophilum TaxID=96345 RepID=UPI0006187651|nr:DUF983 domain-containing protein [Flavobacterium psychrophilum]OAE92617.1 hypothetical protein SU65_06915 [Flavobacterium psychrophilum]
MLKKGLKLNSILTGSCPKCHEESMYMDKNPFHLTNIFKMHETCSHCGTRYKIEPSFFFGAMYVSYGIGIAFSVAAFVISFLVFGSTLKVSFLSIGTTLVLFMPIIMRLSRNIWINFFIHFDKDWKKKLK